MQFPHAVCGFAGRRGELDRLLEHVERDVLFFVYGLPGTGKTELVYQLVGELRARWAEVTPVLVVVPPRSTASQLLGWLSRALGVTMPRRRTGGSAKAHRRAQLASLAQHLDARPHVLVIDDAHHVPARELASALGYLSRHVQASRIIVVSRRELSLPAGARPAVVTMLGALDPDAAQQLVTALAERRQLPAPELAHVLRTTHGHPLQIQRMLAASPDEAPELGSVLDELAPAAGRLLHALVIVRRAPTLSLLRRSWPGPVEGPLRQLTERFLVDREQLTVDPLVVETVQARLAPGELVTAHDDATELCLGALANDPGLAIDAVEHAMAAGRHEDARRLVERWYTVFDERRLLEILDQLRARLPARRRAIELVTASGLVRAARLDEAARVLAGIRGPLGSDEARHHLVAGEVALRTGDRARAAELFDRAVSHARNPSTRFEAELGRARVSIGDGACGRLARLREAFRSATASQRAAVGLACATSLLFDERFEEAAAEARAATAVLAGSSADGLANPLAMVEALAACESGDMERARAAARRIDDRGLDRRVAALYRAIVGYADLDARSASRELVAAHADFRDHGDVIHACLAGHYASAALGETGNLGRAQSLADDTAKLAARSGLLGLAARSVAHQAMLAAEAVQSRLAHALANTALAHPRLGARSRALAHCAHARAFTIEGNIALALEHVTLAQSAVAGLAAARAAVDIEQVAVDVVGGNLDRAISCGEDLVGRDGARAYEAAHACLVLAAAYIARGRRTDLVLAERTLAHARSLADRGDIRSIQVGCAILSAALARRSNRDRAARDVLTTALRELDPERGSIYAGTLLAAIDGGAAARVIPGVVALLGHLGFTETVDCYLIDAHARRAATEQDVTRERATRELFVDELHDVIAARHGALEIRGRPMLCALLSVLVQAGGEPVPPETLYTRVWGVAEYHPLQHRNALYVAINRLRASLREVLPERDLIERASAGWRLAEGVDACAAVAVRAREKTM